MGADYEEATYMMNSDGTRVVASSSSRFPFAAFAAGIALTLVCYPAAQPHLGAHFGGAAEPASKAAAPTGELVAQYRSDMLARPLKNIIECSADANDDSCRMGTSRYKSLGQKGMTLWMTGLSGSGKTTISKALEKELLFKYGKNVFNIDGMPPRP